MPHVIHITRTQAAALIDRVRQLAACARHDREQGINAAPLDEQIEALLARVGPLLAGAPEIAPLEPCPGEAHRCPHIDNCHTCAPRWGLVGPRVVVR